MSATARLAGHSVSGLRAKLRLELDELFSLDLDDPKAAQLEREIIATRKIIRQLVKEEIDDAIRAQE